MQAEAAVEIDRPVVLARRLNRDRRTQLVVALLEVRHDDVQAVGGAALEDRDEDLAVSLARSGSPNQPRWSGAHAGNGDRRRAHEITAGQHDDYLLWKSGEPMTSEASIDGVASLFSIPFSIAVSVAAVGATPSRSAATAAGGVKLKRLMSTRAPAICPAVSADAKSMRPRRPALFAQDSP